MATLEEQVQELQAQVRQLQEQQARTVVVDRKTLEGNWNEARVWLDSIDPAKAGTWQNAPGPKD